jgi:hypothetical protein
VESLKELAIVTDGFADIPLTLCEKYPIYFIPITIIINKKPFDFSPGVGAISKEQFFYLLKKDDHLPGIALPSPNEFADFYQKLTKQYEKIISIHASRGICGSISSAERAIQMNEKLKGKITLIDSKSLAQGLGLIVIQAAKMKTKGNKHDELLKKLDEIISRTRYYFLLRNKHYFSQSIWRKGSSVQIENKRFFRKAALFYLDDGLIKGNIDICWCRGLNKIKRFTREIDNYLMDDEIFLAFSTTKYHKKLKNIERLVKKGIQDSSRNLYAFEMSPSILSHFGEKTIAIAYLGKEFTFD